MERSYLPIIEFYKKCLPAAKANGYRYVVCLLARDTGLDDLFQTLKMQWDALDDVTGKDFLFLFVGKCIDRNSSSTIVYKGNYSGDAIAYTEFIHTLNEIPRLRWGTHYSFTDRSERAKYTSDLPSHQTRHISELQNYFNLSRKDIPCLMFTNLDTYSRIRVPFNNNDLYGLMNQILCDLEKAFSIVDELKQRIINFQKIQESKAFKDYVKINNLRNNLNRIANKLLPEYRSSLLDCMDNLTFGDGIVDEIFLGQLNAFVGLSKTLASKDIKDIIYAIENNEPEHSKTNLSRIYKEIDQIISRAISN